METAVLTEAKARSSGGYCCRLLFLSVTAINTEEPTHRGTQIPGTRSRSKTAFCYGGEGSYCGTLSGTPRLPVYADDVKKIRWNRWGTQREGAPPGCSPPYPEAKFEKHKFCRHDGIRGFTLLTLGPKSATDCPVQWNTEKYYTNLTNM